MTYRHILGRITNEPKTKETTKGEIVVFGVAESDGFGQKNAQGKYDDPPSRFYDVAVFNEGLQEFAKSALYRGAHVAVAGEGTEREYNGRTYLGVRADQVGIVQYGTRTRKGEKPQPAAAVAGADSLDF